MLFWPVILPATGLSLNLWLFATFESGSAVFFSTLVARYQIDFLSILKVVLEERANC